MTDEKRLKGTVLWFDFRKGFGFCHCPSLGCDVCLHQSAFVGGSKTIFVKKGQEVTFEIEDTKKGPAAIKIEV